MSLIAFIRAMILAGLPRSSEDWGKGDLAVCVDAKGGAGDNIDPAEGDLLRVSDVCCDGIFLHFEGKPGTRHWLAAHFRKVRPDTEPAAEEEWVDQLKHFRRKEPA